MFGYYDEVWPAVQNLIDDESDSILESLKFTDWKHLLTGWATPKENLLVGDIVRESSGVLHTLTVRGQTVRVDIPVGRSYYTEFLNSLRGLGYEENTNLFLCPYDWRHDPRDIMVDLHREILGRLFKFYADAGWRRHKKLIIVTHSMGGLVARAYLKKHREYYRNIDVTLIMVAPPNHGAVATLDVILNGSGLGLNITRQLNVNVETMAPWGLGWALPDEVNITIGGQAVSAERVAQVAWTLPGLWILAPTRRFFEAHTDNGKVWGFDVMGDGRFFYPQGWSETYDAIFSYLFAHRSNPIMRAQEFHDWLGHDVNGLLPRGTVHVIYGFGIATPNFGDTHGRNRAAWSPDDGDGTVSRTVAADLGGVVPHPVDLVYDVVLVGQPPAERAHHANIMEARVIHEIIQTIIGDPSVRIVA